MIVAIDGLFTSSLKLKDQVAFYNKYLLGNKGIDKIVLIDIFDETDELEECDMSYSLPDHRNVDYWRRFVREYLEVFRKKLSNQQMESIVSNPLLHSASILKVFLDEIISYGYYDHLSQHIIELSSVSTRDEFYQKYLAGLELGYGMEVVRSILGCLSVSRHGLTEDMFVRVSGTNQLRCSQFYNAIKGSLIASEGGRWKITGIDEAVWTRYGIIGPQALLNGSHAAEFRRLVIHACDNEFSSYSFSEKSYQLYCLGEYDKLLSFLSHYTSFGLSQQEYLEELLFINRSCSSKSTGPDEDEYPFVIQILSLILSICRNTIEPQFKVDTHSLWEYATSIPFYYELLNEEEMIGDSTISGISDYKAELEILASDAMDYLTEQLEIENDLRKRKRFLSTLEDLKEEMRH